MVILLIYDTVLLLMTRIGGVQNVFIELLAAHKNMKKSGISSKTRSKKGVFIETFFFNVNDKISKIYLSPL